MVEFAGVVVDHVEDHLDAGLVQRLDEVLELLHLLAAGTPRGVAVVRCEVVDRLVAPVVAQPELDEAVVVDELVDRHQLDRGHTERLDVIDRGFAREPGVGAAQFGRNLGMVHGEAANVGLVDDRVVQRCARVSGRRASRSTG